MKAALLVSLERMAAYLALTGIALILIAVAISGPPVIPF